MDGAADASGLQEEVVVGIAITSVSGADTYGQSLTKVRVDQ